MTSRLLLDETISVHRRHDQEQQYNDSCNCSNKTNDDSYVRAVMKLVAFNNAAVDQFENGYYELAWALFKISTIRPMSVVAFLGEKMV